MHAVICILLYCGAARRKRSDKTEAKIEIFLNLGFFSLLVAVWTLAQCGFLQFLIPDGRTLYFVEYFSLFLFPVPFNFLLYDICKSRYHKGALIFPSSILQIWQLTFCFSVQELLICPVTSCNPCYYGCQCGLYSCAHSLRSRKRRK